MNEGSVADILWGDAGIDAFVVAILIVPGPIFVNLTIHSRLNQPIGHSILTTCAGRAA